jgi:hypothetical protein
MGNQSGLLYMERSLELRIKGHLYEIRKIDDEVIANGQGFKSAIEGYRKTLESVAECAIGDLVDKVARDVKEHIRSEEERPPNADVRVDARKLLVNEGFLPDEYLNSA